MNETIGILLAITAFIVIVQAQPLSNEDALKNDQISDVANTLFDELTDDDQQISGDQQVNGELDNDNKQDPLRVKRCGFLRWLFGWPPEQPPVHNHYYIGNGHDNKNQVTVTHQQPRSDDYYWYYW